MNNEQWVRSAKNVKLRFSYKAKKEIVVLYVTRLVCHTKQTSLWNRGPWVARCRAPAPALRSPPGFVTFFANPPPSTLLYNPTLLYNLLYKSTPSHLFSTNSPPPSSPPYHPASHFLASSNEILIVLNWKTGFSNVDTKKLMLWIKSVTKYTFFWCAPELY